MDVILASKSPRRRELLEAAGVEFRVVDSHADETLPEGAWDDPAAAAEQLACRKAEAVARAIAGAAEAETGAGPAGGAAAGAAGGAAGTAGTAAGAADGPGEGPVAGTASEPAMVIGADTVVVLNGRVFGKPADPDDARRMLRALSGRTHQVITGVAVWRLADAKCGKAAEPACTFASTSQVRFKDLSDADIDAYLAEGESFDKAGAYAIQGKGRRLVADYQGSWSNIVGLPVEDLLARFPELATRPNRP